MKIDDNFVMKKRIVCEKCRRSHRIVLTPSMIRDEYYKRTVFCCGSCGHEHTINKSEMASDGLTKLRNVVNEIRSFSSHFFKNKPKCYSGKYYYLMKMLIDSERGDISRFYSACIEDYEELKRKEIMRINEFMKDVHECIKCKVSLPCFLFGFLESEGCWKNKKEEEDYMNSQDTTL